MHFERTRIASVVAEVPPAVLSSAAIEDRLAPVYQKLGLHAGRLELMTGIAERRYWPDAPRPSAVAARAGALALAESGVAKSSIGVLIHASVCRDFLEPATAAVVHDALGLPRTAQLFDLSNACLGVLSAMTTAGAMIEAGFVEAALIVSGEIGKPLTDATIEGLLGDATLTRKTIKPAVASLTIGSGAAAVVLAHEELAPRGHRLVRASALSATEHNHLCQGDAVQGGLQMATDSEALLDAGVALAGETWRDFSFEPTRVVTHQVGRAHSNALFSALGLDPSLGYSTFERLGNVGSASVPMSLAMAAADGFVRAGDRVALLGIGSGLACTFVGVEW